MTSSNDRLDRKDAAQRAAAHRENANGSPGLGAQRGQTYGARPGGAARDAGGGVTTAGQDAGGTDPGVNRAAGTHAEGKGNTSSITGGETSHGGGAE